MRKDFALCFNDAYTPYACITIKSIANNMHKDDDVYIHIISDYISIHHRKYLRKIAQNACVKIYTFTENDVLVGLPCGWTVYAWYRIYLPQILDINVHRVLYLDCDVVVNDSLDTLFMMDMKGKSIAACLDIESYYSYTYQRLGYDSDLKYISSGVLLMNLKKWRESNLCMRMIKFAEEYPQKLKYPDQDSINYLCCDDKIVLPPQYGVALNFFREKMFVKDHLSEMKQLVEAPLIVHYAGYQPWVYHKDKCLHSFLWWKIYNSLHAFPQIRFKYIASFIKYWIKVIFIYLKIIKPGTKHYIFDLYYCHPRIKKEDVIKIVNVVKNEM